MEAPSTAGIVKNQNTFTVPTAHSLGEWGIFFPGGTISHSDIGAARIMFFQRIIQQISQVMFL
jgi:hypothetical protein